MVLVPQEAGLGTCRKSKGCADRGTSIMILAEVRTLQKRLAYPSPAGTKGAQNPTSQQGCVCCRIYCQWLKTSEKGLDQEERNFKKKKKKKNREQGTRKVN